MLVSLLFIVLLRFLAGVMVWVMIVLVILVIGYGESSVSVVEVKSLLLSKVEPTLIGSFSHIPLRDFPLLHGVRQPEGGAGRRRHHH